MNKKKEIKRLRRIITRAKAFANSMNYASPEMMDHWKRELHTVLAELDDE